MPTEKPLMSAKDRARLAKIRETLKAQESPYEPFSRPKPNAKSEWMDHPVVPKAPKVAKGQTEITIPVKAGRDDVRLCCKCGAEVDGFARAGKVLAGFSWVTTQSVSRSPETFTVDLVTHRIPVSQYVKGLLCETCSADITMIPGHHGEMVPVVITDSTLEQPKDQKIGFKSGKRLNTTRVQMGHRQTSRNNAERLERLK